MPFKPPAVDELEKDQVVLQGVDAEHKIIPDVPDPEGQAAGLVDLAGRRPDLQGNLAFLYEAVLGDRNGKMKISVRVITPATPAETAPAQRDPSWT
jgi:hypothetical protein